MRHITLLASNTYDIDGHATYVIINQPVAANVYINKCYLLYKLIIWIDFPYVGLHLS